MIGAATCLFEQILEQSHLPRTLLNSKGEVLFMNEAFRKLLGFEGSPAKSKLQDLLEPFLVLPEYMQQILHPLTGSVNGIHEGKIVITNLSRKRIKLDFTVNVFATNDGLVYSYEWSDVTEKIAAQKALKSASERLELAADINHLGVWEYEFESNKWILNQRMFEIFGIAQNEFSCDTQTFIPFFGEVGVKDLYARWTEAKISGGRLSVELKMQNPLTGQRLISLLGKCLLDSSGKPWRFVGTVADITDEKTRAEDILIDRSRLRSLIDSQSNYLIRMDKDGFINFCNHSFRQRISQQEECKGHQKLFDFLRPEAGMPLQLIIDTCLANPGQIFIHRTASDSEDGKIITVEWEFIANNDSEHIEIQGFGRDISERMMLNDKVQETLENIKSTINNFNNVSIWSIDHNYKVTALNNCFKNAFLDYNKNQLEIGENILEKVRPDIKNTWKALYDDVFEHGAKQLVYEIDGQCFEVSLNPIQVENKTSGIAIYGLDITENRRKEQALRESEERLQFAIEGNQYVVWETDIENNQVWFSESFSSIFGYPLQEVYSLNKWVDIVHPDDLNNASQTLQNLIEGSSEQFYTEFRMKDSEGKIRWVLNMGKTFERNGEGKAKRIVGLLSDITERKTNEEKMRETMEKLEKFAHLTSHSLRRPLANIIGISNLLKEEVSLPENLFDLVIEIRKSALALDDVVKEMTDAISFGKANISVNPPVRLKKVWFIDDDEINNMLSLRMMNRVLPESEAKTFLNAEEALQLLMEQNPALPDSIFLDINMPRMNGWEFLDELAVRNIQIPIYMLTSSIDPRDQEKAGNYEHVKDFISKPLREERLKMLLK